MDATKTGLNSKHSSLSLKQTRLLKQIATKLERNKSAPLDDKIAKSFNNATTNVAEQKKKKQT